MTVVAKLASERNVDIVYLDFAKAFDMVDHSILLSKMKDIQNIKIRPLVIILLWNILGHQQTVLNSLLSIIPNRNYRADRGGLILQ